MSTVSTSTAPQPLKVLLCSAVDPNFIDGAVVQLVSLAEVLTIAGFDVAVQLRGRIQDRESRLTQDLVRIPGLTILEPEIEEVESRGGLLSYKQVAERARRYVRATKCDLVIVRDLQLNLAFLDIEAMRGRLCSYLTNIPENTADLTPRVREQISAVAEQSRIFFTQTEEARSFLEAEFPEIAGKTALMHPMIPDSAFLPLDLKPYADPEVPLELVYSGKFKYEWKTLEMTELPERGRAVGAPVEVVFMGDKFMNAPGEADWVDRMRAGLEHTPGVQWLGAVGREESVQRVSQAAAGLSWRDISVDMSSQLSTKVLEYAAAGTPPLLRRNSSHEALLGADYPLFIEGVDVLPTVERMHADRDLIERARRQAQDAVRAYSFSRRAEKLRESITRVFAKHTAFGETRAKTKLLIAGHDFKFLGELIDFWSRDPGIELVFDKWDGPKAGRGALDQEAAAEADVIFCEWATNNAVWYSKHKAAHQKLIVRMHRFEMFGGWPERLDVDAIDAFVVIAPHIGERFIAATDIAPERVHLIPNSIDALDFDRPKAGDAQFHIGMAGIVPIRKRPDRAIALLRELRTHDERYTLHLRGRLPSSYRDFDQSGFFRLYYQDLFQQFTQPGPLFGAVLHDRFGPDMANWFRRVGWVLSPSTNEGSHQAVAEGMASGAVPMIWDWEGAAGTYPAEHVFPDDIGRIAEHIIQTVESGTWQERADEARQFIQRYDIEAVHTRWTRLFRSISES